MKRSIILLCIIIGNVLVAFAQVNLDSLWAVWNDASQPDTIRLKAIQNVAWKGFLHSKPDSAFRLAQAQYEFAKERGLKPFMAGALNTQGVSQHIQSNYDKAIHFYLASLEIRDEIDDKVGYSRTCNNIGLIYYRRRNYVNAFEYFNESLKIKEELGDKKGVASTLNNIGNIYLAQHNYPKANEYYLKSLRIIEDIDDKNVMGSAYNNVAIIYREQGDLDKAYEYHIKNFEIRKARGDDRMLAISHYNIGDIKSDLGEYEEALKHYINSLEIARVVEDKHQVSVALDAAGLMNQYIGNNEEALKYHIESLEIAEEVGTKLDIANVLNNIGNVHYRFGNYSKAVEYSRKSLSIAQEIEDIATVQNASESLWKSYRALGQYSRSLEMHELYTKLKDSLSSEETTREILSQQFRYEYEEKSTADSVAFAKEQEVKDALILARDAQLEKSRIQQYALYGGIAFLLIFLLYVYNRFRVTTRQKSIIAEQNEEITTALETLRVAQAHLVQSEKMASLGQLTAGIAHEINNPLNFIQGNSAALSEDLGDIQKLIAKYREVILKDNLLADEMLIFEKEIDFKNLQKALYEEIEGIKEGTRRTTEIVKGLREFSHDDQVQMESVDIHHGIDVTLNLLKSRINENIRITKSYDQSIGEINCHAGQLNQVFMNLLVNALDAIGEKGEIEIITKNLEEKVMISVKDDGPGIPEEILRKVFDPFFTTKDVGKGTGLGLSISHGIIENHGGKIEVQSPSASQEDEIAPSRELSGQGGGVEVVIWLPKV